MSTIAVPNLADPKLQEVVRRLIPLLQPIRVYVFGSYARGTAGPDSDYDLLFVVPDHLDPKIYSGRNTYSALRGTGIAVDVIVITESQFKKKLGVVTSLSATVAREGRVIYVA